MNSAQIHLALTHLPVVLSLTGLVMLVISFINKKPSLTHTSYFVLAVAALAAVPVYLTGESAEEMVEELAGVSESIIHQHETVAAWAFITIVITGIAALVGIVFKSRIAFSKVLKVLVLVAALGGGALMAQTAHLGGQIRHSEIRSGATALAGDAENVASKNGNKAAGEGQKSEEDDD